MRSISTFSAASFLNAHAHDPNNPDRFNEIVSRVSHQGREAGRSGSASSDTVRVKVTALAPATRAAIRSQGSGPRGVGAGPNGARIDPGKARLTGAQLRRANELIDRLETLLWEARGESPAVPLYAMTLVLTPAREAGESEPETEEGS